MSESVLKNNSVILGDSVGVSSVATPIFDLSILYDEDPSDEYVIGWYIYSDGTRKPVYRRYKTTIYDPAVTGNDLLMFTDSGWNIDKLVNFSGNAVTTYDTTIRLPLAYGHRESKYVYGIYCDISNNAVNVYLCSGTGLYYQSLELIFDYTKTTDTPV